MTGPYIDRKKGMGAWTVGIAAFLYCRVCRVTAPAHLGLAILVIAALGLFDLFSLHDSSQL